MSDQWIRRSDVENYLKGIDSLPWPEQVSEWLDETARSIDYEAAKRAILAWVAAGKFEGSDDAVEAAAWSAGGDAVYAALKIGDTHDEQQ